jgi:predicted nuclease with TOPRIM domain
MITHTMITEKEINTILQRIDKKNSELREELKTLLGNEDFIDEMFNKYKIETQDIRIRKKREKVNDDERCQGIKKNGETCSRRKLEGKNFCGTHCKQNGTKSVQVEATVRDGIVEYIDPVSGQQIPVEHVVKAM